MISISVQTSYALRSAVRKVSGTFFVRGGLRCLLGAFEDVCGDKFEVWDVPALISLNFKMVYEKCNAMVFHLMDKNCNCIK